MNGMKKIRSNPFIFIFSVLALLLLLGTLSSCDNGGDEDMQRRDSKNPVVNMINRATDKVEDRMLERKRKEAEEKALRDKLHPHKQRKSEKRKK